MAASDDFTFVPNSLNPDYSAINAAAVQNPDVPFQQALRRQYPDLNLTVVPEPVAPVIQYAALGHASAELDTSYEAPVRWRGIVAPPTRGGGTIRLGDSIFFAKYNLSAKGKTFIVYVAQLAFKRIQYILTTPGPGEDAYSHSRATDALILDVKEKVIGSDADYVWFFDNYWTRSRELWLQVQKASWDKVILEPNLKSELEHVASSFFDSRDTYAKYGVPWKRGLIFYGPPGNGKTISIKALMRTLYARKDPIPSLYVRNVAQPYQIGVVFQQARALTPCCLIFEDVETIVTDKTRSIFFNEIDGIASNDGILLLASTNYLDRLDPGLTKRPSRFDRKYNFPRPNEGEREQYAHFWQRKLQKAKSDVPFPDKLCLPIAKVTTGFSFAFLQEAFIATMLSIARDSSSAEADQLEKEDRQLAPGRSDLSDAFSADFDDSLALRMRQLVVAREAPDDDDLGKYKLWRIFKEQVSSLKKELGNGDDEDLGAYRKEDASGGWGLQPDARSSSQAGSSMPGTFPSSLGADFSVAPITGQTMGASNAASSATPTQTPPTQQELQEARLIKGAQFAPTGYQWA